MWAKFKAMIGVLFALAPIPALATTIDPFAFERDKGQWLCVGEQVTGFIFRRSTQTWTTTVFNPLGKYVVRRPSKTEVAQADAAWVVMTLGDAAPMYYCDADFNQTDVLICDHRISRLVHHFVFNRDTLRFTNVSYADYVNRNEDYYHTRQDEEVPTPFMQIGTCTLL
jgi:hypothetical protein